MPRVTTRISTFWPRLSRFATRAPQRRTGLSLYEAIVAQARSEPLYRNLGVPDTVNGRFEMIVLHVVLVVARLQAEGEDGRELARATLEAFVADVDDACRRLGIGDMGVPRHVKKATAAVLERGNVYRVAMAAPRSVEHDPLAKQSARTPGASRSRTIRPAGARLPTMCAGPWRRSTRNRASGLLREQCRFQR